MKFVLATLVLLALLALGSAAPLWPRHWDSEWNFVNTSNRVLLNYGVYFYRAQSDNRVELRIDNINCPHNPSLACRVIFALDSNCYVYAPDSGLCCTLFPGLKASSPDWLKNATYQGIKIYNHQRTNAWLNVPFTDIYYETIKTSHSDSIPVALSGGGSAIEWNHFIIRPQPQDLFDMPNDGSCKKKCSFSPAFVQDATFMAHSTALGISFGN
jgi:hypothetical protein